MQQKKYGEFKCPHCEAIFFIHKKLMQHIGGAHKRNITQSKEPHCKFCGKKLIKGDNWATWAIKQRNLICTPCKRLQNNKSYRTRKTLKKVERENKFEQIRRELKERINNAKHS